MSKTKMIIEFKEPKFGHNIMPSIRLDTDKLTNGDMIKAMFPNAKIIINEILGEKGTVFVNFENPETVILFDLDWWNAPYKRGNEDE